MSIWETYENRANISGNTKREAFLNRERRMLHKKQQDNLSYHKATIDGEEKEVIITSSKNTNEKLIHSINKSDFQCGSYVQWMDNYWLVTEYDANDEVYAKATMVQCNHLLKWIDSDGIIHEQWCIIADGTKYMTGEYEDRNFIVTRGDSRIVMTISKNEHTVKFDRESRFLIDDPDTNEKLAYSLTKPLKVGLVYNNHGVYCFILQETVSTDKDNHQLSIADYYKYYHNDTAEDDEDTPIIINPDDNIDENGRKMWL